MIQKGLTMKSVDLSATKNKFQIEKLPQEQYLRIQP